VREAAKRSGVDGNTILTWRATRVPSISNFEAVANALGYELHLVRRDLFKPAQIKKGMGHVEN
jgi:hypothetical protein